MEKEKIIKILIAGVLFVLLVGVFSWSFTAGYVRGVKEGIENLKLENLCNKVEKRGEFTDFAGGRHYEIYECYVDVGSWEDYWEVNWEDWEKLEE